MLSAFGIDHGGVSKAVVHTGEYGFSSNEGRKRTQKEIMRGSRMSAGHGNKQRMATHVGIQTPVGAGLGAMTGLGMSGKYKAIGAGVGAAAGAGMGALTGKAENVERSAQRNVGRAIKRGDIRRVKHGERTTSFRNVITKD